MSIVRIGLAETDKFGEGYDAIFGKSKGKAAKEGKTVSKSAKTKGKKKTKKS
jgi:hypothetical protein